MSVRLSVVGPTASGKTALASALAQRRPSVELISIDAIAVYRGFDVGAGKPPPGERASWHLLDLVDANEEFSVAQFQQIARRAIEEIEGRSHDVVAVGGTGLYHRAVIDDLAIPGRYHEIAAELDELADQPGGLERLYERLCTLDLLAASRIAPSNRRRLLRALEVCIGSGQPFSSFGPGLSRYGQTAFTLVGLRLSLAELDRRIAERLDAQFAAGFVEEVASLLDAAAPVSRTAAQGLGYRELIEHLEGKLTVDQARGLIEQRTKRFARRQLSWFGRDPRVRWLDASSPGLLDQVLEIFDTSRAATPCVPQ